MEKPRVVESCDNCGGPIGKLEKVHVWEDHVVCGGCLRRLKEDRPLIAKAERLEKVAADPLIFDPARERKAAAILFRVFFWIVAGIIILLLISQIGDVQNMIQRGGR